MQINILGKELSKLTGPSAFGKIEVHHVDSGRTSIQLDSPYKRSAEVDLLQRLTKKCNDEFARPKAAAIKEKIVLFVRQKRLKGTIWETPEQRKVTWRMQAEAAELEPFLKMRLKLYRPIRRPV